MNINTIDNINYNLKLNNDIQKNFRQFVRILQVVFIAYVALYAMLN